MRIVVTLFLWCQIGLLAGCTSESVYGNIFEGLKTRETIVHPSAEQKPAEKSMTYQEYQAERKKLLENKDKK
jgi:hypothetical protein